MNRPAVINRYDKESLTIQSECLSPRKTSRIICTWWHNNPSDAMAGKPSQFTSVRIPVGSSYPEPKEWSQLRANGSIIPGMLSWFNPFLSAILTCYGFQGSSSQQTLLTFKSNLSDTEPLLPPSYQNNHDFPSSSSLASDSSITSVPQHCQGKDVHEAARGFIEAGNERTWYQINAFTSSY